MAQDEEAERQQKAADKAATDCWWAAGCSYSGPGRVQSSGERTGTNTIDTSNTSSKYAGQTGDGQLYLVKIDVKTGLTSYSETDCVDTQYAAINGMLNDIDKAVRLMARP